MKKILLFTVTIAALFSCGEKIDKSIKLTSTDRVMYFDDEFQIEASSVDPIEYTSEDEYHAKVSESGLVTAGRVGETHVVLSNGSDSRKLKITVTPESNLYPEPDLTFGMTKSEVTAKLGNPDATTEDALGWKNYSSKAPTLMTLFDKSGKMSGYAVMVKTSYSRELGTFLAERYVPAVIDKEKYSIVCMNSLSVATCTMVIGADIYNTSLWMVMYIPYPPSSRGSAGTDKARIMESLEELMK